MLTMMFCNSNNSFFGGNDTKIIMKVKEMQRGEEYTKRQ